MILNLEDKEKAINFVVIINLMTTQEQVKLFLSDFKSKMKIWDVIFRDDRGKNLQTLLELEIRPIDRKTSLEKLKLEDYSEGPINEILNGGSDMWVFGIALKNKEIYIKISMGFVGTSTICISFHIAEHPMNYPFKTNI